MSPTEANRSDFETVSDSQISRSERYRQLVDELLLAPARIVWNDWRARIAITIISVFVFMGTVGIRLVKEPRTNQGDRLVGAFQTLEHPLGTTPLGVDIMSQIIYATVPMLKMITAGAVFSVVVATTVGTISGYKGGTIDRALMALTDVMLTIPGLPLVIVLAGVMDISGNPYLIGVLLSINAWAGLARALRSQVLTLRDADYVEAARLMGIPTSKILTVDIIPNLMPYITMNFVKQARAVIFGSVGLYYLGILPYSTVNWGVMMNNAVKQAGATSSPAAFHWLAMPMLAIILLSMGLTLFAQSADRLFNPRVRARHAKSISGDNDTTSEVKS
ncbi:ABC transporter permease [Natrinema versiforme]|uniref:ABC transporter permease n=1 Tax=Natrinema versiforme TaxID=88724 RepID=UPI001E5877F7|nr:ABC transporter permease [Natrinema versiforme]